MVTTADNKERVVQAQPQPAPAAGSSSPSIIVLKEGQYVTTEEDQWD